MSPSVSYRVPADDRQRHGRLLRFTVTANGHGGAAPLARTFVWIRTVDAGQDIPKGPRL